MLALQSADGVAFNNYHGFLIFRRKGGRPNLLSPFFFLSKEEVKSKPTRARGNQPLDLREVADARVAFLVREQEERVRREAGKGSGLLSHAAAELQKTGAAAGGVINAGPLAVTSHCLI